MVNIYNLYITRNKLELEYFHRLVHFLSFVNLNDTVVQLVHLNFKSKDIIPNIKLNNQAKEIAKKIANKLNYIGTMCVEFFVTKKNELLVNEIAPRVHNSGHLTMNAHNVSQFENHIRAVCNLKLKKPKRIHKAIMYNILGNDIKKYRSKEIATKEFFYDYGKKEIKNKNYEKFKTQFSCYSDRNQ